MLVSSQHIDVGAHQKSNKCFLNVIVGAGALVSKDLESNGVYIGVSAKRICSFDDYVNRHCEKNEYGGGIYTLMYGITRIYQRMKSVELG